MIACRTRVEHWAFKEPFEIARVAITEQPVLWLELNDGQGHVGVAEAAGVDYDGETPASMARQIAAVQSRLHDGLSGSELLRLLPAGGARNALDCALWDLRAKQSGTPVWRAAGLPEPAPLLTAFTLGLGDEATTRRKLQQVRGFPLLKLKLDARRHRSVVDLAREVHPDARLVVDANQAWSLRLLEELLPHLLAAGVELIEQPLARAEDGLLRGLQSPVPIAADESCTDRSSLDALVGCYDFINIKLDKCGGLTEALMMLGAARERGFGLMVGNMCGTSLAMAPAHLLAQTCAYADLDGALLQREDRDAPMRCENGILQPPLAALWG